MIVVAVLVGAILAGAYVAYVMIWPEGDPPPSAARPAHANSGVTLVKAEGRVEHNRGKKDWVPVEAGTRIGVTERLRTDVAGSAELDIGGGSTVVVANLSEVVVSSQDETETRLSLQRGRVSAKKRRRGKSILRIEAPGTRASVFSEEGSFTVTTDGLGTLALAATAGNAGLDAADGATLVAAGQQSVAFADGSITETTEIPKSLLLKVGELPKGIRRKRSIVVRGRSEPGAIVQVNGVRARVTRRGRFVAEVPLREGHNPMSVRAEGVAGAREELRLDPIVVDSRAPKSKIDAVWE
jgi:hypothetical protein